MNRRSFFASLFLPLVASVHFIPVWEVLTHTTPSITSGVIRRPNIRAWDIESALETAKILYPDATRWTVNVPEPLEGWDNVAFPASQTISIGAANPSRLRELGRWNPYWVQRLNEEVKAL